MRFKILWALLISLFVTAVCYNFAFATSSSIKQKLFGPTKPNDTLWIIAEHSIPAHSALTINQVMVAIYANNISAFSKGNMNILLKNKWLKIPSVQEMRAIPPTKAFLFVKHHEIAWQKNEEVPGQYAHVNPPLALKTQNQVVESNVLEQSPPKELTLPYTPLLRPVASLNFVFVSPDELRRIQKDKILPLVLKPSVIAQHIQVMAQEPMSALQTFDMWTLLSTQLQELAIRFDKIEKHQEHLQQQFSVIKQNDVKQTRQIQVIEQQLKNLDVSRSSKHTSTNFFSSKSISANLFISKSLDFFKALDSSFPIWPWVIAIFATGLVLLMGVRRYVAKKRTVVAPIYPIEAEKEKNSSEPIFSTSPASAVENVATVDESSEEIRIRPKAGSLHEAVAEILTVQKNQTTLEEENSHQNENESDFSAEDEISSLLDLARAYSDMGDRENAQLLIDRVIAEGSELQRKDAEQLMTQLP